MPGLTGWNVLNLLRKVERLSTLPVLMFTTASRDHEMPEARKYGVDILVKPMSFRELEKTCDTITGYCRLGVGT